MGHKNKLPDVFNTEQLVKLFDAIDQPKVAIAVAVTFYCGLRISEICNLKIEHVDLTARKIKIVDAKNSRRFATGYGNDRYVPLPPHMISPIKKWLEIIQGGVWFLPSDKSPDTHIRPRDGNLNRSPPWIGARGPRRGVAEQILESQLSRKSPQLRFEARWIVNKERPPARDIGKLGEHGRPRSPDCHRIDENIALPGACDQIGGGRVAVAVDPV